MSKAEKLQQVTCLANLVASTLYDQWVASITPSTMRGVKALDLQLQTIIHLWNALITQREG